MSDINYLNVLMRVLHITAAIIAVGGSIFAAFVVLPATRVLPQESREHFHEAVRRRALILVMASILFLLVSGFYNYLLNEIPAHRGQPAYHMMMGVKILLAFAVFLISSALTGRSAAFVKMREKRRRWMRYQILASLAIVVLAAVLRAVPPIGH